MRMRTQNTVDSFLGNSERGLMKRSFTRLAALLACLALGACGHGGGDGGNGPSIGYLIDAPVGGVTYACGVLTGTTGSNGSFHFDPGTACAFTIGKVTVGSVGAMPSDGIVTPHDLAGVSRSDALNTNAVAIAQFLQSLDDGTQSTSINIPASVVAALSKVAPTSILSKTSTPAEIQSQVSTLVSTATNGTKALVAPGVAAANLNTYLQASFPNLSSTAGVSSPVASSSPNNVPNLAVAFPATLTASNTSVGFSATADVNAVGYWELLPASAESPTQWQVISGLDSKNAAVALSGNTSMAAATTASFNVTGLAYSTGYKLYFVVANASATGKVTQVYSSSITTAGAPQAPVLSPSTISTISSTNGSAIFPLTSDVTGTGYWVVLSAGTAPTAAQVIAGTDASNAAAPMKGSTQMTGGTAASISAPGLAYSSSYTLYFVASNLSDTSKLSQVLSVAIQTGPPPPPNITAISSRVTPSGTTAVFSVTVDAGATGYWVALNATAPKPSAAQIMAGKDSTETASAISGNQKVAAATATNISATALAYSTAYTIYFVASTSSSSASATVVQSVNVDTTMAAPPTTFTVSGTAATGAAFDSAAVTIIDSNGTVYGGGATDITGADGTYSITLPLTAKPPFVVMAVRDDRTLVSVIAEAKDTTTNITPVTNLIASRLSTSGDPAKLAGEIKADPALVNATKLTAKVTEVVALIKPVMDAIGDNTDPLNGKLVADGNNADKLLASLSISITPSSATTVNIEVSVKQKLDDGVDPAVIGFTNTTAPASALPPVTDTDLVPNGTDTLITDFLQRMTACYALTQANRVTSGGIAAADIIAPACRTLFSGDDPANYKHNGGTVSSTGAFSSIFGSGTGMQFDRGNYEMTRANGDLVIAYRATDSSGNKTNNTLLVTTEAGKLKAIGNQYKYSGSVTPWHQKRSFINQPAPGATYFSTGYTMQVNNTLKNAIPIFAKVVVTTPRGAVLTLKPLSGYSYLPLVKNPGGSETVTGTNFLRIRSAYEAAANSAKDPSAADTSLFFASSPATDAEIKDYPAQRTWRFDYYLASAPTVIDATQYYRTRARPMTIQELQKQPLPTLTEADIASAKANTKTGSGGLYLPTPTAGPLTLNWVWVASKDDSTLDLAPTQIRLWGAAIVSGKKYSYEDSTSVASTARSGNITCSSTNLTTDKHCDAIGSAANFTAGGLSDVHLWANASYGREFTHHYAYYTITIP